jgi:hypothetical protein
MKTGSKSGVGPQGSPQIAAGRRQPDCGYLSRFLPSPSGKTSIE